MKSKTPTTQGPAASLDMALRSILVTLIFAYTFFDYTESTSAKSTVTCQFKVFPNNPNLYYEIVYSGGYLVRQCHYGSKFSVSKCSCANKTDAKPKDNSTKKTGKMKEAQKTSKSGLGSNKHTLKTKITIKNFSDLRPSTSTPASTTTKHGGKSKKFSTKVSEIHSIILSFGKNSSKKAATNSSKSAPFKTNKNAPGGRATNADKTKNSQISLGTELAAEVPRSANKSGLVVLDADTSIGADRSTEASSALNESDASLSTSEEEESASKDVTTKSPVSINKTCSLNANAENPTKYYELVPGHGYYIRDCAEGTAFSPVTCGCTLHAKGGKEKSESKDIWKKPVKQEPSNILEPSTVQPSEAAKTSYVYIPVCRRSSCADDPTKYFEHVQGHGFYLRTCPRGTAFNPIHCQCSIHYGNSGRVVLKFKSNNAEEEEDFKNPSENGVGFDNDYDNGPEEEEENEPEEEEEEEEEEEGEEEDGGDFEKTNVRSLLLNLLSAAEKKYGTLCHLQSFLGDATKYYNTIARIGRRVQHCPKGLVFKFEYCRCIRKKVTIPWKKILPYIYI